MLYTAMLFSHFSGLLKVSLTIQLNIVACCVSELCDQYKSIPCVYMCSCSV